MFAQVEDFLKDDDFIHYILGVNPEVNARWESYFREHPEDKRCAEEAKEVLLAPTDTRCDLTAEERCQWKDWILNTIGKLSC